MHDCTVFVINDAGTWMLKRPQDFPRDEIPELIRQAREKRLLELYEKAACENSSTTVWTCRVQVPVVAPFNKWMSNVPGTTFFLPVAELSALYINVMLSALRRRLRDVCGGRSKRLPAWPESAPSRAARAGHSTMILPRGASLR